MDKPPLLSKKMPCNALVEVHESAIKNILMIRISGDSVNASHLFVAKGSLDGLRDLIDEVKEALKNVRP